jgi:hypothetical protein
MRRGRPSLYIRDSPEPLSGSDESPLYHELQSLTELKKLDSIRLLVDYSSMSRLWFNGVLNWIRHTPHLPPVTVDFVYALGRYRTEYHPLLINDILLLPGCDAELSQSRKTITLFGLGFDGTVALSLYERLEPDVVYAFYASPGASPGDEQTALTANERLLSSIARGKLGLPIRSVSSTVRQLRELVAPALGVDNIMVVPLGPKPHALAAMLLSRMHPRDIACLRVRGSRSEVVNVQATGELVITRVHMAPKSAL